MTLFDRYIAVDWSAANERRAGKDSIWVAELGPEGPLLSLNPPTRAEATTLVIERLKAARAAGERVLVGFDFVFGYPRGAARAIAGKAGWRAMWDVILGAVTDSSENHSNRFEVANTFNRVLELEHFWGHPPHHRYADLKPTKPQHGYLHIAERRIAEAQLSSTQPVWKLTGAGSVGSQALLGIPRVQQVRDAFRDSAIWPFETEFEAALAPITMVEMYPSMFALEPRIEPRDRAQVEAAAHKFADLDDAGLLGKFLSFPATLLAPQRRDALEEEGWIAGAGHEHLLRIASGTRHYLRDPDAIYAQSFATIRAEADLTKFEPQLRDVVIRMIHACGMPDIAPDIRAGVGLVRAASAALAAGAPILCDCEAVRAGLIARHLKGNELVVTLNDERTAPLANRLATTRSAAAVDLWRDKLNGAIVVIGNAPTALFHLLELLDSDAPKPAAIIATPVGFVGAAESKAALAESPHGLPYLTLLGRRGGSAIASAALNAIAKGTTE